MSLLSGSRTSAIAATPAANQTPLAIFSPQHEGKVASRNDVQLMHPLERNAVSFMQQQEMLHLRSKLCFIKSSITKPAFKAAKDLSANSRQVLPVAVGPSEI